MRTPPWYGPSAGFPTWSAGSHIGAHPGGVPRHHNLTHCDRCVYMHAHQHMSQLPITLNQGSGVPFYRQIVDQLTALVRAGQLEAGQRLPSYRDLASDVVVSLITVRRAYAELESAGLVVRKQGQGTFVADDVSSPSRGALRKEARRTIEAAVEHARGLGLPAEDLLQIVENVLAKVRKER